MGGYTGAALLTAAMAERCPGGWLQLRLRGARGRSAGNFDCAALIKTAGAARGDSGRMYRPPFSQWKRWSTRGWAAGRSFGDSLPQNDKRDARRDERMRRSDLSQSDQSDKCGAMPDVPAHPFHSGGAARGDDWLDVSSAARHSSKRQVQRDGAMTARRTHCPRRKTDFSDCGDLRRRWGCMFTSNGGWMSRLRWLR